MGLRSWRSFEKKSPRRPRPAHTSSPNALGGDLFRTLAETATDIIVTIDEHSRILFINSAVEKVLGYPAQELVGREITILMPDYLKELHRAALGRYLATGQRHISWTAAAMSGLHRTGREVPLEVSIGEQIQGGERTFTGIIRDVSGRQQIEEELRQSNQKYIRMIQSSPDAITLRTLPERRYLEVNEGFCRMTGYTAEEVIGKTSAELRVWADPEQRGVTLQKVLREGQVHEEEFRFRTKSGEVRFGQLAAVKVTVGNQQCMLSVSRDITEKKHAEEELRRSEASFRSLAHDAPFGILRVTPEGRILQANPALVRMLGYESEEELGKLNMERDVYHDPKQRQHLLEENLQKGSFHNREVQWKRKDGNVITVLLNGRRVAGPDPAQTHFEEFVEDITQRRTLERQLFQAQKMEAIGRLAGGIAHDFNNLLGVVLGHTEILEETAGRDKRLQRSVEAIENATQRATALTRRKTDSRNFLRDSRRFLCRPTFGRCCGAVCAFEHQRHGRRHGSGNSFAHLRTLFHHQGKREGHRARALDRLWNRETVRRLHHALQRAWPRHDFQVLFPPRQRSSRGSACLDPTSGPARR